MVVTDSWSLFRNTVSKDPWIKWSLFLKKSACQIWRENYLWQNQPFAKIVEAANNLTKLVEVGKHFTRLLKFANNFTKFVEFANNFMKFVEFASNFTKFVGLAKNFWKVRKTCKKFMKFVIGRSDLSAWKFFFIVVSLVQIF